MSLFTEIEEKLRYAEYLLNHSPPYPEAAVKHLLRAANKLVQSYLNLPRLASVSPFLASQKLCAGNDAEKKFGEAFLHLWKLSIKPTVAKEDALNAYKAVKAFLEYYKTKEAN
ncbi:MAG: hypothetical protein ACP5IJ_01695 [Candidatus Nanoarchaeia archaeon]